MTNKATKVSSNLVLNGSASYPLNILGFDLKNDVVAIKVRETEKVVFTLKAGDEVNGVAVPTLKGIFDLLTAFSNGGGDGNGVTWDDVSFMPEPNKVVSWSEQGLVSTGTPQFPENAVSLAFLDIRIPEPPASGNFVLKSVNGVTSWVSE